MCLLDGEHKVLPRWLRVAAGLLLPQASSGQAVIDCEEGPPGDVVYAHLKSFSRQLLNELTANSIHNIHPLNSLSGPYLSN